jgi:hypothetical protein
MPSKEGAESFESRTGTKVTGPKGSKDRLVVREINTSRLQDPADIMAAQLTTVGAGSDSGSVMELHGVKVKPAKAESKPKSGS